MRDPDPADDGVDKDSQHGSIAYDPLENAGLNFDCKSDATTQPDPPVRDVPPLPLRWFA